MQQSNAKRSCSAWIIKIGELIFLLVIWRSGMGKSLKLFTTQACQLWHFPAALQVRKVERSYQWVCRSLARHLAKGTSSASPMHSSRLQNSLWDSQTFFDATASQPPSLELIYCLCKSLWPWNCSFLTEVKWMIWQVSQNLCSFIHIASL